MSVKLAPIEVRPAIEKVKRTTQELDCACTELHWRYDLLSNRHFPVQYYAVALRGSGPGAEETLLIAIECFDENDERLIVSASIAIGDGAIVAEAPQMEIERPPSTVLLSKPELIVAITERVQVAFDRMVDWVNQQGAVIQRALA